MPGRLPGWTRKDIGQLSKDFLRVEMLIVLYILEVLTHNNMPGSLRLVNRYQFLHWAISVSRYPGERLRSLVFYESLIKESLGEK